MSYWSDKKVLVTGARGFVGTNLVEVLWRKEPLSVLSPSREELDLTVHDDVREYFTEHKPDVVLHLAGKVGGIGANRVAQADFFFDNITMGTYVMNESLRVGAKTVALAAGCGYPEDAKVPFTEEDFWNGLPDRNSIGYSMAKKNLIIQSWTYREQYGFDSTILLPANLYGPHDNFDLETSHVVPALVRKFITAEQDNLPYVTVWGTGKASREFLYVEDTACAILNAAESCHNSGPYNLGTGVETSVKELVETIKEIVGYEGEVAFDRKKPDGQTRRFYDMSNFRKEFGYLPSTSLKDGLETTVKWYRGEFSQK